MKKKCYLFSMAISIMTFLPFTTSPVEATIIDVGVIDGINYFQATSDNSFWIDVSEFYGMNYYEIENQINGYPAYIATAYEVAQLLFNDILPDDNWENKFMAMAEGNVPSQLKGFSSTGSVNPAMNQAPEITIMYPPALQYEIYMSETAKADSSDSIGGWVRMNVNPTAPVPEPATMLLIGTGLAAFAGTSLKRKRNS